MTDDWSGASAWLLYPNHRGQGWPSNRVLPPSSGVGCINGGGGCVLQLVATPLGKTWAEEHVGAIQFYALCAVQITRFPIPPPHTRTQGRNG